MQQNTSPNQSRTQTQYSVSDMAAIIGVTPQQVSAGLMVNAKSMRNYSDSDLKRWGKSRNQANKIANDYERRAKSKFVKASDIKQGDTIIRFGHPLSVIDVRRRIHPLTKTETISILHETATVDFTPSHQVEII